MTPETKAEVDRREAQIRAALQAYAAKVQARIEEDVEYQLRLRFTVEEWALWSKLTAYPKADDVNR